ncbi:hypothetical protein GCM10029976_012870 [Kribbella albertanoniae]
MGQDAQALGDTLRLKLLVAPEIAGDRVTGHRPAVREREPHREGALHPPRDLERRLPDPEPHRSQYVQIQPVIPRSRHALHDVSPTGRPRKKLSGTQPASVSDQPGDPA